MFPNLEHDALWSGLQGARGRHYDPRPALKQLVGGDKDAWSELWNELQHAGTVGTASYAAVPVIMMIQDRQRATDWNPYALVGTIELCRLSGHNPPLPSNLQAPYEAAMRRLTDIGRGQLDEATDERLVRSIQAMIALSSGAIDIARAALPRSDDELSELLPR